MPTIIRPVNPLFRAERRRKPVRTPAFLREGTIHPNTLRHEKNPLRLQRGDPVHITHFSGIKGTPALGVVEQIVRAWKGQPGHVHVRPLHYFNPKKKVFERSIPQGGTTVIGSYQRHTISKIALKTKKKKIKRKA